MCACVKLSANQRQARQRLAFSSLVVVFPEAPAGEEASLSPWSEDLVEEGQRGEGSHSRETSHHG